jgi:putative transposase
MDGISKVTTRQRHTPSEVATKLTMADEMAAQGQLHGDIAKSLGISVMTYHRWRKARRLAHPAPKQATAAAPTDSLREREQMNQIHELRLENLRLRRLVADLLLEKDKLEEGLRARTGISDRRAAHS